jgi:peptide chain release factor subunit 1
VDKESVRLFSVALGRIEAQTEAFGEELKHHKQGGWAAARYQRHEDNLALHNLKQAVDVMQAFCDSAKCGQLVLGGSTEALHQIRDLLPKQPSFRVLGEFAADMQATPNEILSRSLDIAVQVDRAKEKEHVSEAVTAAAKGRGGATGLADSLALLHEGRVKMLLVDEDYGAPGFVCPSCGYVATEKSAACPLCSHEGMVETSDVVNLAIHKAVETGAGVNIVRDNEELTEAGGIAALLRY